MLVGDFATRGDAVSAKDVLAAQGVEGFVRSAENFDKTAVQAAITGAGEKPYFSVGSTAECSATTLTEILSPNETKS